jgi:beta-xylosidase
MAYNTGVNPPTSPWVPDLGDGRYRNPVVFADYSDPDAIRVGDDYWMTASSFTDTPGLPILHSRDLVNWRLVNHAIKQVPHERYAEVHPGCGVWAPAIRHHAGKFWIFFPLPDEGIYVTTASDPAGAWSEPWCLVEGKGLIDPCPLWDDDGKAYLVIAYARSRAGIKDKLRVLPMAPDATKLLGEGQIVFDEPVRHRTCEGPKFHKWDGYYYISAPAGGVATGWQLILRSKNVYGPYEEKVVLEQGSSSDTNGPHQGAIVDTPTGEWWFLHFQELQPYGRIVHLQPMTWKDGWPAMGEDRDGNAIGEPVALWRKPAGPPQPIANPATSDEFDSQTLGLQWQWHANHKPGWHSLTVRPGWLRLIAQPAAHADLYLLPHALLQKLPAPAFTVETSVELTGSAEAGFGVIGNESAALIVCDTTLSLQVKGEVIQSIPLPSSKVRLRIQMHTGGLCHFAYATGDAFVTLPQTFQAIEGKWIGAKVGVFCSGDGGHADFDYFRFVQ